MGNIKSISTALPTQSSSKEEVLSQCREWLATYPEKRVLFERFLNGVAIDKRHFVIPVSQILELGGIESRTELFIKHCSELAIRAARRALVEACIDPTEIGVLIFTSCTGSPIPTIDTAIIQALGLSHNVLRMPFYQLGCAGGAVGLSIANDYAALGKKVLLVAAEACSLCFHQSDASDDGILGAALFGDGAAAAVIVPDHHEQTGALSLLASQSNLIPNSCSLMGYEQSPDGPQLRLERELPMRLSEFTLKSVPQFLTSQGVSPGDVRWWLLHPGGVRILQGFEETFGLDRFQVSSSWDVLREVGNLSSASLLFVMRHFLERKCAQTGELAFALGVGPGLTVQLMLLRVN